MQSLTLMVAVNPRPICTLSRVIGVKPELEGQRIRPGGSAPNRYRPFASETAVRTPISADPRALTERRAARL